MRKDKMLLRKGEYRKKVFNRLIAAKGEGNHVCKNK